MSQTWVYIQKQNKKSSLRQAAEVAPLLDRESVTTGMLTVITGCGQVPTLHTGDVAHNLIRH